MEEEEEEEGEGDWSSKDPLLLLLNASSKKIVLQVLDDVWRARRQGLSPACRALLKEQLQISEDSEVDALITRILGLLRKLVYTARSEEEIQCMLPRDFHPQLEKLLIQLLSKGQNIWREEAIQSQVSLPRLLGMTWDIKNETTTSEHLKDLADSRAIIHLKVKDYTMQKGSSEQDVKFQVTRERLKVMLESLHNVRDQLTSITF